MLVILPVALVVLLIVDQTRRTYLSGGGTPGAIREPPNKLQRLRWGLRRRVGRLGFVFGGATAQAKGLRVATVVEWGSATLIGVIPPTYQFVARRTEMLQDPLLFAATVAWFVAFLGYAVYTRIRQGRTVEKWNQDYASTSNAIGGQIEAITRMIYAGGVAGATQPHVKQVLEKLLSQMGRVVRELTTHKSGTKFCIALFILEDGTLRNAFYTGDDCSHLTYGPVPTDRPGAGRAFVKRELQVVEDTTDPCWGGLFTNPRYRSLIAFPILTWGQHGECIGCVSVDCSNPYVLSSRLAQKLLADAVRPQLEAIGLAVKYAQANRIPLRGGDPIKHTGGEAAPPTA